MSDFGQEVRARARAVPGLSLLVLFGSRARGRARPTSDVDVAILADPDDPTSRRHLLGRLAAELADMVPEGRADVVFLDEAPELLRQRIMEHGEVLVCRDPAVWRAWRVRTMREHGDREWARRLLRRALRDRLTRGGAHGRSGHALRSAERARRLPG
jgi:predicted nucleotidyltransferase